MSDRGPSRSQKGMRGSEGKTRRCNGQMDTVTDWYETGQILLYDRNDEDSRTRRRADEGRKTS